MKKRYVKDYSIGVLDTLINEVVCECQTEQMADGLVEILNNMEQSIIRLETELVELKSSKEQMEYELKQKIGELEQELYDEYGSRLLTID